MNHLFKFDSSNAMFFDILARKSWPSIYEVRDEPCSFCQTLTQWREAHPEAIVYTLDGLRMRNQAAFESELIKTFNLPDYYGENFNALYECLTDEGVSSCNRLTPQGCNENKK